MKNNSSLNEKHLNDEGTKERIVSEALKLFCFKGYENTAVREIVEAANVSKPVLYYYFKNKDSLFKHIIETNIYNFNMKFLKIIESSQDNVRDTLIKLTQEHLKATIETPDLLRFIHSIIFSGLYDNIFDFHKIAFEFFNALNNLFLNWQKKGLIRKDIPSDVIAGSFLALVRGTMMAITYKIIKKDKVPTSHDLVEIFLGGVKK